MRMSVVGRPVSEWPVLDAARGRIGGWKGKGNCLRMEIDETG